MPLGFLNSSRSYDSRHRCISFWGYDSAFEITFRLSQSVLNQFAVAGSEPMDEVAALAIFDANLSKIRDFAKKLYNGNKKNYFEITNAIL